MTVSAPDLVSFVHAAPTPFHLVTEAATRLEGAGFTRLQETELWAAGKLVVPGGRYFYHRNMSTIGNPTLYHSFVVSRRYPHLSINHVFCLVVDWC